MLEGGLIDVEERARRTEADESAGAGCCVVRLESLAYGAGRNVPLFVMGTEEDDRPVKFRYYGKKECVGIDPRNKDYAYEGSQWLMGYIAAKDGAADLYVSIPLDILWKREEGERDLTPEQNTAAAETPQAQGPRKLEDIIFDIEHRDKKE